MTTQEFHETIGQVVGNQENHGIHVHIGTPTRAATAPRRRSPPAMNIHNQWQRDFEEDQAFIRATRIAATRPERLLLQRLIHTGARHEHVRELWEMRMLKIERGQLVLRNQRLLPWASAIVFLFLFGLSTPLAAIAIKTSNASPFWLLPLGMFAGATFFAAWCGREFLRPWRYANRYRAVVDEVNNNLGR